MLGRAGPYLSRRDWSALLLGDVKDNDTALPRRDWSARTRCWVLTGDYGYDGIRLHIDGRR